MSYRLQSITTFNLITSSSSRKNITSCSQVRLLPFPIKTRVWSCNSSYTTGVEMENPTSFKASDVVIDEPVSLNKKKAAIRNAGPAKLQVIADFDATLTRYWVDGRRGNSSHGLLQQENPEFDLKREELFRYYHPLEFSPTIPIEEKTQLMEEWVWSCNSSYTTGVEMENPTSFKPSDVVIDEPISLNKKKAAIRNAGPAKLQVIADFDATLTRYWVDGRRGNSSHGLLQQENPEFDLKREELFRYYHPLEFSPTIPIEEKTHLMEEWWEKTHSLLIEGGVTYDAIRKSVANANNIAFREGVVELFEILEEKGVPVLIFSAGLADIIEEVLRQKLHRSFKNVKVVANRMVFDQGGRLTSFKGKTIHVLNKNEHALDMAEPVHDHLGDTDGPPEDIASVKKRTNVLLLGDHIGDLRMSDGLNYENRISVGFLNDNVEKSLDNYKKAYDVLYLNDASMSGVVELATQLCSSEGN